MSPSPRTTTESPVAGRTRQLVEAPITPTLLRLAMPNVVVMVAQALVSTCEVYFIGWLGPEALAQGCHWSFPSLCSCKPCRPGVWVAALRQPWRGPWVRATAAMPMLWPCMRWSLQALWECYFTTGEFSGGPALYRAMGGEGRALAAALTYSNVVFAGALGFWLFNILASVVRGTGNMLVPAALVIGGGVLTLTLSPALILGWGPLPALGIAGAGLALLTYYSLGSLVLLVYLWSGTSLVPLAITGIRLQRPHVLGDPARGPTRVAQYGADHSERRTAGPFWSVPLALLPWPGMAWAHV